MLSKSIGMLRQQSDRPVNTVAPKTRAPLQPFHDTSHAASVFSPVSPSPLKQAQSHFEEGQRLCGSQRFSDAAKSFAQAVDLKHAHSHALLANMLIDGRQGVPKDLKRAFELASAGAGMGCAHSKGVLGRCYSNGFIVAADHAKALALGMESAAAGSCMGQHVVGLAHALGRGVAKDQAEAVRWYRLAADQGYAPAQHNLGILYDLEGALRDKAEAVRWYHLAAAQGLPQSQDKLKERYLQGGFLGV